MFTCNGDYRTTKKHKSTPSSSQCSKLDNNKGSKVEDCSFLCTQLMQSPMSSKLNHHNAKLIGPRDSPNTVRACLNDLVHNVSVDGVLVSRSQPTCSNNKYSSSSRSSTRLIPPAKLVIGCAHKYSQVGNANSLKVCTDVNTGAIDYSLKTKSKTVEKTRQQPHCHNYTLPATFKAPNVVKPPAIKRELKTSKKENCKNVLKHGKGHVRFGSVLYEHKVRERKGSGHSVFGPVAGPSTSSSFLQHPLLQGEFPYLGAPTPTVREAASTSSGSEPVADASCCDQSPTLRSHRVKHMLLAADLIHMMSSFSNPTLITWLDYFTNFCEMNRQLLTDIHFANLQTLHKKLAESLAEPLALLLLHDNFDKCVAISRRLQSIINQHLLSFMAKK